MIKNEHLVSLIIPSNLVQTYWQFKHNSGLSIITSKLVLGIVIAQALLTNNISCSLPFSILWLFSGISTTVSWSAVSVTASVPSLPAPYTSHSLMSAYFSIQLHTGATRVLSFLNILWLRAEQIKTHRVKLSFEII